jgi:transcriptional regulator with XRE-family HTH domain
MPSALRAWRDRNGWTLDEVSGLTGVSVSYLSLVERGQREPPAATKVQIARGVGAKVGELFPAAEDAAAGRAGGRARRRGGLQFPGADMEQAVLARHDLARGSRLVLAEIEKWPPAVSVPRAAGALGISRSTAYEAIRTGEFPCRVLEVRGRKAVVTASLLAVLSETAG